MKSILTILKRELGSYFNSPIAYIYLVVFAVVNNGLFMTRFFLAGRADMKVFFDTLPIILFIFIPVITMRLWAEDKKENTFELLMTFPIKPQELVLGKFFASLVFYFLALLTTIAIPIVLYCTGSPDFGVIFGGYLGAILIGGLFLAMGIFISGLTSEQIVAFVITTLSCFTIFFLGTDFFASLLDGWISGLGTFSLNYIGAASHVNSFIRGVLDIKDIVYFILVSAIFLILNGLFLEGRFRPKAKIIFSAAVAISLFATIIFNWLIHDFSLGRFDITENKIYTVSDTAKSIFKELKVPVLVSLYITPVDKMPTAFKNLETDIVGKLQELKLTSGGKFNYKVFHIEAAKLLEGKKADTSTDTESLEKKLQDKGIVPFQVESIDRDEVGLKLVYSALTLSYKEKPEEILPRILPQSIPDLEYLFFSRIAKLMTEKKPKIVIFSPLKTDNDNLEMNQLLANIGQTKPQYIDEYKTIVPLLRSNGYDVERISLTKDSPIPKETNTLLILNPGSLNDRQLYEINKFIYQGGKVVVAASGFDYSFQMMPPNGIEVSAQKSNLDINKLIKKWGVGINEEMLMDENSQVIQASTGQRVGPFALSMPLKVPNQIKIDNDTMNRNAPFMMRLPALLYLWGSALDVSDDILAQYGLKKTLLFTAGARSWKVPYSGGNLGKELLEFPKTGSPGKFTLGVLIEGQFNNSFADFKLSDWPSLEEAKLGESDKKEEKALMDNPKPGKLVVVGCSKMFNDDLINNPGNLGIFSNLIDGLTLGDNIIKIRSKSYVSRDIKRLTDNQKILYKVVVIFVIPIILVIYASLRLLLRRKEKQFYLAAIEK